MQAAFTLADDGLADAGVDDYARPDYDQLRTALPSLPFQYYREVFDALDLDSDEVVIGDIYDDLTDIHRDLSQGLFVHEHASRSQAERHWSQSFRDHWGEHATSALRSLYCAHRSQPNDP